MSAELPPLPTPVHHWRTDVPGRSGPLLSPLFTADQMHTYALAATEKLRTDNHCLRTVMIAAAEEIHAHWNAHCDAEGYGPANLMRRLEDGIPVEYGYTAGAFAELKESALAARRAALEEAALLCESTYPEYRRGELHELPCFDDPSDCAAAIRALAQGD